MELRGVNIKIHYIKFSKNKNTVLNKKDQLLTQYLGILATLPEDLCLIPSTQIIETLVPEVLASLDTRHTQI